jgi:hypothetical protein
VVTDRRLVGHRRQGGRRSTDLPPEVASAPAGAALTDRLAYLEGSVEAAWEALDGHFQRFRDTQAELDRIRLRLQQLADAVQVLTAAARRIGRER